MGKILISTLPIQGHLNPALAVARRLAAAGHDLRFALPPKVAHEVTRFKCHPTTDDVFSYVPVTLRFSAKHIRGDIAKIERNIRYIFEAWTESQLHSLRQVAEEERPDLIIADTHHLAPLIVAHERKIPSAVLGVTPYRKVLKGSAPIGSGLPPARNPALVTAYDSINLLFDRISRDVRRVVADRLIQISPELKTRLGSAPLSIFGTSQELGAAFLQCSAPCLEDRPASQLGVEFIGPMNPADHLSPESHSRFGNPRTQSDVKNVVITWGTMQPLMPLEFIAAAKALVEYSQINVAIAPPRNHRLEAMMDCRPLSGRASVTQEGFDNFLSVLKSADVFVSNGGFGAVKLALTLGVPVVSFGNQDDKPDVCGRVRRSGAGIGFRWWGGTRRLVNAVRSVLADDSYRKHAGQVGKQLAEYDRSRALESTIQRLLGQSPRPGST
jgi:UDP:flavonoid glycosyltransferase YjiC (YdhE family)